MNGTYTLPWDTQASATFQSLPGTPISANYVATNAQIAPSLGRNLSGGSTASIPIIAPFTQFEPRINQLDLRLSKNFKLSRLRIKGNVDLYNATNANPVVVANTTYSSTGTNKWLQPQQILDARLLKFSAQVEF